MLECRSGQGQKEGDREQGTGDRGQRTVERTGISIIGIANALWRDTAIPIRLFARDRKVVVKLSRAVRPPHHPCGETRVPLVLPSSRTALGALERLASIQTGQLAALDKVKAVGKVDGIRKEDLGRGRDVDPGVCALGVEGIAVTCGRRVFDRVGGVGGLEGVGAVGRGDGGWEFAGREGFEGVVD